MRCLMAVLTLLGTVAIPASAQTAGPTQGRLELKAHVIRIAYTAFEGPEAVQDAGTLDPIVAFLRAVSDGVVASGGRPLEFELVIGNYYQVWSWFRGGQIDAAFVSPFTAYLLEREGTAAPVLELPEQGRRYDSLVAASGRGRDDPHAAYVRHLQRVLREAAGQTEPGGEVTRLNFVAHLSSSGFVIPALYALDWLDSQSAGPPTREQFWRRYFERARFTLHHGVEVRPPDDTITDIFFSYTGRHESRREADRNAANLGKWATLAPDWKSPGIPPDRLVVRPGLLDAVLQIEDRDELADRLVAIAARTRRFTPATTYTSVERLNIPAHTAFRDGVDRLFGPGTKDPTLITLTRKWFEQGRFDFTIDETMGFLRHDQRNSGVAQLALVLSGGGVKSLYQARHLDELYGSPLSAVRHLRNINESPTGRNGVFPAGVDGPLTVHTIIGTSGGAMLAFYSSLVPSIRGLTALAKQTASERLFPLIDIPRVASVLLILLVFVTCLHLAKTAGRLRLPRDGGQPWEVPRRLWVLSAAPLLLILTAVAIRWLRVPYIHDVPHIRGIEGLLFAAAGVLIHMGMVCVTHQDGAVPAHDASRKLGTIGLLLGVSMIATAVALHQLISDTDPADWILAGIPLLAGLGIVMTVAGFLLAASAGRFGLRLVNAREYLAGLGVVACVVVLSHLAILGAIATKQTSWLELSWKFWAATIVGGVVVSLVVIRVARRQDGLGKFTCVGAYSLVRDRVGGLTLSVGAGMTAFFTLAVALWIVLVAPAVYGSERARDALVRSLDDRILRSEVFRSNLIVTGTLLENRECPARARPYIAGPLYSCFEGPTRCIGTTSEQWELFRRPVPVRALQAVFASGSPFPVFPAYKVAMPNGCEVPLVDGGYAHNVPLEAAVAAEARQVLVINASPEEEERTVGNDRRMMSDLAYGARRIFPFLFARAQELDRSMARRLMVASLTPHPADTSAWPFLLDFSDEKQQLVIAQAELEIRDGRRIGHIEAWGTPLVATVVRAPESRQAQAAHSQPGWEGARWLPHVQRQLERVIESPGGVAAFDLDNTILRGDIGDALFLKIVAELHYAGNLDEFWALIPNADTREALRAYWRQFQVYRPDASGARLHYADPLTWPAGFADYVALFQRQYRELLEQPDGARRAYPWVVQLMTGMTEQAVRRLSNDLWSTEMLRGQTPQAFRSSKYGESAIEGGVRVHGEIVDLFGRLEARGFEVWIITASNQFVAEEVADHLGIRRSRVVGIRPRVINGLLTSELETPITYREGKLQALVQRGLKPQLVAGDSMTDYEMLRAAPAALVIDRGRIDRALMTPPTTWLVQPVNMLTLRGVSN